MGIVKKMFEMIFFVQIMLLIVFILLNYNTLDEINIYVDFSDSFPSVNIEIDWTINFYVILGVIILVFAIILVSSITVFGFGLNEIGTTIIGKFMYIIALYTLLLIPITQYVLPMGLVGFLLNLVITIIWLLRILQMLQDNEKVSE